MYEVAVF